MNGDHSSLNQIRLKSLRKSIVDKPPYISGTLQLPHSFFSLFYKVDKDGLAARYINLANATQSELEQLTQACEPDFSGVKQEHVSDETYCKAGKMDSECFSSMLDPFYTDLIKIIRHCLLEGLNSTKGIKAELYKLNIYSKGSLLKPNVNTPRSGKMFGSLVVVFPTPHEGGALFLRHRGHEWTFDSGQVLAAVDQPAIGYVALFNGIEHEVAPVTSGHRITLTYNLYFDDGGPISENDAVSEHLISPQLPNQDEFREAFKALLEDPEFMADGGTLAFGLRHVYPIKEGLKQVYNVLKGSDAVVHQSTRALGFEPVLYVYYEDEDEDSDTARATDSLEGVMINKLIDFRNAYDDETMFDIVRDEGGILIRQDGMKMHDKGSIFDDSIPVEWVTPLKTYNSQESAFASCCGTNKPELHLVYGDICMIVRIGKTGDRLAYPTATQMWKEHMIRYHELRDPY